MRPFLHHSDRKKILAAVALLLCTILPCILLYGCGDANIPEELLALRERNPETAGFVNAYEAEHDKHHDIDLSGEYPPGEIPLFLQWDLRWGYETYGSKMIALTGCGPTCLSMVAVGLTGDLSNDPLSVARFSAEQGYYHDGVGTAWALISEGSSQFGLDAEELPLDEESICDRLGRGQPIICSVGPGDFTTEGHFIVLTKLNDDGRVSVNDPNSLQNSRQSWDVERLIGQIQNLWALSPA